MGLAERMRGLLARTAIAAACLAAAGAAQAAAIDQLREFARGTKAARGEFTQQTMRQGGGGEVARGAFWFSRPGRFRWEVRAPYEQLIVTDGKRLHFYDKDLRQVTVRRVSDAIAATPAAILFGSDDLEKSFELKELGERAGLEWLEALPRGGDAGFERIAIGMRGGLPGAMEVRDSFGQTTRFEFRGIERNPGLDLKLFEFTVPDGVDVVE